jgi:hypothetical protein
MEHEVRHDLDLAEAKRIAHEALESYRNRFAAYRPEVKWLTDSRAEVAFAAKGLHLRGGLEVFADRLQLRLEVPLLLRPFKSRALAVLEREVAGWIQKAKVGGG